MSKLWTRGEIRPLTVGDIKRILADEKDDVPVILATGAPDLYHAVAFRRVGLGDGLDRKGCILKDFNHYDPEALPRRSAAVVIFNSEKTDIDGL